MRRLRIVALCAVAASVAVTAFLATSSCGTSHSTNDGAVARQPGWSDRFEEQEYWRLNERRAGEHADRFNSPSSPQVSSGMPVRAGSADSLPHIAGWDQGTIRVGTLAETNGTPVDIENGIRFGAPGGRGGLPGIGDAPNLGPAFALPMRDDLAAPAPPPTPAGFCATLRPDEELWVIQRPHAWRSPADDDDVPGCGALVCLPPTPGAQFVPVPLAHTDVKAEISGYIASVNVSQRYENSFSTKIEAVYVFPLPENAAVSEFVMTVGDRRIRGVIRERAEAEMIYNSARAQGYTASLMTQERPNVFTQRVANIEPGKAIDIDIRYFHTLACRDGEYEFDFPMVVGPRFNPPCSSTGGVGAIGYTSPPSGQPTDVRYLRPDQRSGHDISLAVSLDAGVHIETIESPSHTVWIDRPTQERARVVLSSADSIPNRDFVLRYRVAGDAIKSGLITHRDENGGFFTLMLYPPKALERCERTPLEMIFVLDCSGSMNGEPLAQARDAVDRALMDLRPDDTFQLINFSNSACALGAAPLPATRWNIERGRDYLRSLRSEGGTMMIEGVRAALCFPHDPRRLRVVAFLTDGFIGNEADILRESRARLGDTRIFSFGVGTSPNRFLLDALARMGRGAVAYLGQGDSGSEVMDLFFQRVSRPALTDITIDWGGLNVTDVYPPVTPDLFIGRPVVLTGRFTGVSPTTITVKGRAGERPRRMLVSVDPGQTTGSHQALAAVWARARIENLTQRAAWTPNFEPADEIRRTALAFGLMSSYTSFIAIDTLARTKGDYGVTVDVPVNVPQGTRYSTTVSE